MTVVVEYVRYRIPPEQSAEFAAAYARASSVLDADPHCLGHEVAQGVEEPENWVVRITWTSVEDHEQGFRGAPHFREFFAAVRPYVGAIQEMKHYRVETSGS